jgi:hypothetical protein
MIFIVKIVNIMYQLQLRYKIVYINNDCPLLCWLKILEYYDI